MLFPHAPLPFLLPRNPFPFPASGLPFLARLSALFGLRHLLRGGGPRRREAWDEIEIAAARSVP